jgi:hypothetical protein
MKMLEDELKALLEKIMERERLIARSLIVREIQAFAGDYSHPMTQNGVTRDVLIVEQLLDFLMTPSNP